MKLPIAAVLSTTIVVSLLGIVAIVSIFVTMHRNSAIDGAVTLTHASVQHVEKAVRGPFDAVIPQIRAAAASLNMSGAHCGRFDDALLPAAFRELGTIALSNPKYFAVYQSYRMPRPNAGAPAGTRDNADFPWGDCGCTSDYCFVSRYLPTPEYPPDSPGLHILAPAPPVSTPIAPVDAFPFNTAESVYGQTIMRLTTNVSRIGVWGIPEVFFSPNDASAIAYVSFHVPVEFDAVTGFAVNALSGDLSLAAIADFLAQLDVPATRVAVVDREAHVVLAQTFPGVPAFNTPNASEPENSAFWTFDDVPDEELRRSLASLQAAAHDSVSDQSATTTHVETDSTILGLGSVQLSGLRLAVLVVSDKEYYLRASVRARNVSIAVGAIVFVLLCAAIVAATVATVRPIARVAAQVRSAADFNASTEEDDELTDAPQRSVLAEVADLQDSYAALHEELTRVRGFVPQAVLLRYDAGDDATDDDDGDLTDHAGGEKSAHSGSRHSPRTHKTKNSHGVASSAAAAAVVSAAALGIGLKEANVTVVVGNVHGYTRAFKASSVSAAVHGLAATVDELTASIHRHGGVLTLFHGDHFVISFNAARTCTSHRRKACQLAGEVTEAGEGTTKTGLSLKFGIATGPCLVGNLGSKAAKASSVVGPAFTRASMLERLTRVYGCSILTTRAVASDLAGLFPWLYLDLVRMPATATRQQQRTYQQGLIAAVVPQDSKPATAALPGADAEWLYTVNADGGNGAWEEHNRRFEKVAALAAGNPVAGAPTGSPRKCEDDTAAKLAHPTDGDGEESEEEHPVIPFGAAARLRELEGLAAAVTVNNNNAHNEGISAAQQDRASIGLATYCSAADAAPYGGLA